MIVLIGVLIYSNIVSHVAASSANYGYSGHGNNCYWTPYVSSDYQQPIYGHENECRISGGNHYAVFGIGCKVAHDLLGL